MHRLIKDAYIVILQSVIESSGEECNADGEDCAICPVKPFCSEPKWLEATKKWLEENK